MAVLFQCPGAFGLPTARLPLTICAGVPSPVPFSHPCFEVWLTADQTHQQPTRLPPDFSGRSKMEKRTKFIVSAAGIFTCYFYFGILQEKLTRGVYGEGEDEEHFTCILALVFVQCVSNYLFAKLSLATFLKQGEDTTTKLYYASCAITYILAMVCSNMALQWITYPTQVVGKSGKPIPVMILGVLLGRKSYPIW